VQECAPSAKGGARCLSGIVDDTASLGGGRSIHRCATASRCNGWAGQEVRRYDVGRHKDDADKHIADARSHKAGISAWPPPA